MNKKKDKCAQEGFLDYQTPHVKGGKAASMQFRKSDLKVKGTPSFQNTWSILQNPSIVSPAQFWFCPLDQEAEC